MALTVASRHYVPKAPVRLHKRHLSSLSVAIAMHYNFISMLVNHREHKGPRLEARPWSMAAFYNFKAAVSDFHSDA